MVVDSDVDEDVPMPCFVHACSFRQISVRIYIYTRVNYIYIYIGIYILYTCMDGWLISMSACVQT
jgi:hypothetical protein